MIGRIAGIIAREKQQNNLIVSSRCTFTEMCWHPREWVILHETFNDTVETINNIKRHPLNERLDNLSIILRNWFCSYRSSMAFKGKHSDKNYWTLWWSVSFSKRLVIYDLKLLLHKHIFTTEEKFSAFHKKIYFWMNQAANGNLKMFQILTDFLAINAVINTKEIQ